jgi:hypothetical protein
MVQYRKPPAKPMNAEIMMSDKITLLSIYFNYILKEAIHHKDL